MENIPKCKRTKLLTLLASVGLTLKEKKLLHEGKNPYEFSRVRQYAPIKTRKKRIRSNAKRKTASRIARIIKA